MASSAADFNAYGTREVTLARGLTVTVAARDFLTLFLEGVFEMPLLTAFQKLIEQAPMFMADPSKISELAPEARLAIITGLRTFACAVCESPTFVMVPDGNPDHVSISRLASQTTGCHQYNHSAVASRNRTAGSPRRT